MGTKPPVAVLQLLSGEYFELLGVRPVLGRLIGPEDNAAEGASLVVVLLHHSWSATSAAIPMSSAGSCG